MKMNIIEQLQQHRLIFTASPGRCGTQLLAMLLNLHDGICAEHEPTPYVDNTWWRLREHPGLAKPWLLNAKLPSILKRLKRSKSHTYIETSHMLCKGFFEPLLDLGIPFDLIVLSRDFRQVAMSMYELNDIPERTKTGKRWYPLPSDQSNITRLPEPHHELSDYQLCYWYVLEMSLRQNLYYNTWVKEGQTAACLTLRDMLRKEMFREFLSTMHLPEFTRTQWHDYKVMTAQKVNAKRARKSFMRHKGRVEFYVPHCPEQEEEVKVLTNYKVLLDKYR